MLEIIVHLNSISTRWLNLLTTNTIDIVLLTIIVLFISYAYENKSLLYVYFAWQLLFIKGLLFVKIPIIIPSSKLLNPGNINLSTVSEPLFNAGITDKQIFPLNVQSILFILWVLLILSLISILIYNEVKFYYLKKTGKPFTVFNIEPYRKKLNIKRRIDIKLTDQATAPFSKGIFRPTIYLPVNAEEWNTQQLEHVICHELIHIKQHDLVFIWIQNIVSIVHFFNPIIWYARYKINLQREKYCDNQVIDVFGVSSQEYSATLKHSIYNVVKRPIPILSNGLSSSQSILVKRFKYIFDCNKSKRRINACQYILFTFLLMIFSVSSLSFTNRLDSIINQMGMYSISNSDSDGFFNVPTKALQHNENNEVGWVYKKYIAKNTFVPFPVPVKYQINGSMTRVKVLDIQDIFILDKGDKLYLSNSNISTIHDINIIPELRNRYWSLKLLYDKK